MRGFCISKAVKFKGKPAILFLVPNPVLVKKKKLWVPVFAVIVEHYHCP